MTAEPAEQPQIASIGLFVRDGLLPRGYEPQALGVWTLKYGGMYQFPGGRAEYRDRRLGATMVDWARAVLAREIREELGVDAVEESLSYLTVVPGTIEGWRVFVFHVGRVLEEPRAAEVGTHLEWLAHERWLRHPRGEFFRRVFPDGFGMFRQTRVG